MSDTRARRRPAALLALSIFTIIGACHASDAAGDRGRAGAQQVAVVTPAAPASDSAFAPAALVARFRATSPDHPARLGGAAATDPQSLLRAYVRGVERTDTAGLAALALTRGEFAWLYYLDSPMAQKPYELDPDVMWQQMRARSDRGLERALAAYGGHSLGAWHPECGPPRQSGALALRDCAIVVAASGTNAERRLRLSVVELGGRFKLASLATSL